MNFHVIRHVDEAKYVCFKAHSPYWTDDRFMAAAYESEADAATAMRRHGIPHCVVVVRGYPDSMKRQGSRWLNGVQDTSFGEIDIKRK